MGKLKPYLKSLSSGNCESQGHIVGNFAIERDSKVKYRSYDITHIPTGILMCGSDTALNFDTLKEATAWVTPMNDIPGVEKGELGKPDSTGDGVFQAMSLAYKIEHERRTAHIERVIRRERNLKKDERGLNHG